MAELILPSGASFLYRNTRSHGDVMYSHHYHDRFEIYYMVSGRCRFFINDRSYDVLPGDVVLVPERVIHKTNYGNEEHSRILIECTRHFIPEEAREELSDMVYLYRNASATGDIYSLLRRIEEEYKNPDEYTFDAIRSLLHLLIYRMIRNKSTVSVLSRGNAMIENVVGYVKDNFASDLTLSGVAQRYFVSAEHLSRTFKRQTGFCFNEFLTLVRLQHAEYMLKNRNGRSISEIAYLCGFNDSNYFSDKFKKAYGKSPLRFAKEG